MATTPPSSEADADALMMLLTDALRAGPASPEWSRALAALREQQPPGGDDYQLLLNARQNLESGRGYREVRGGPEFGRRVRDGINAMPPRGGRHSRSLSSMLIGLGVMAVVFTLLGLGIWLLQGRAPARENLNAVYLNTVTAGATFDGPLPTEWRPIGPLALDPSHGLQPIEPSTRPTTRPGPRHEYIGGGVVLGRGLPANEPLAVEAVFNFGRVSDDLVPELFVSDVGHFSRARGTSSQELAWLVRAGQMKVVLPDGRFAGQSVKLTDKSRESVRIVVGLNSVRIVANDQVLYDGLSGLNTQPRFVGVRLLSRSNAHGDVRVASIQVLQP